MESNRQIKELQDEINYIGRYMGSISPALSRYKELETKKRILKAKLKELGGKMEQNETLTHTDNKLPAFAGMK